MKVLELRFNDQTKHLLFKGKWRKVLRPGQHTRDDEIAGLEMSLNPQTGIVSIDAPGDSTVQHLSVLSVRLEPSIPVREPSPVMVTHSDLVLPQPSTNPAAKRIVTKAELGYDPAGDDLDDAEIRRLMQSPGAKKAPTKRKAGPKPKASSTIQVAPKAAPEPDEGDE